MSGVTPATRSLIDRLQHIDFTRPPQDRAAVERALGEHFKALGRPPPAVLWALDPLDGIKLASEARRDYDYEIAWRRSLDAADDASRSAHRFVRGGLIILFGAILVIMTAPPGMRLLGLSFLLFAASVFLFRPLVLTAASFIAERWPTRHESDGLVRLPVFESWGPDAIEPRAIVVACAAAVLIATAPAMFLVGRPADFGAAAGIAFLAFMGAIWTRTFSLVAVTVGEQALRLIEGRSRGRAVDSEGSFGLTLLSLTTLSLGLVGVGRAFAAGAPLGVWLAAAGALACWSLHVAAERLTPRRPAPTGMGRWALEAFVFSLGTANLVAIIENNSGLLFPAWLFAVVGWSFVAVLAHRVALLLDNREFKENETTLRITWIVLICLAAFLAFMAEAENPAELVLAVFLIVSGGAWGWAVTRAAGWIADLHDAAGKTARKNAVAGAIVAIPSEAHSVLRTLTSRRVGRTHVRSLFDDALTAVGEVARASAVRGPIFARREAVCRPLVDAFEAGLLLMWVRAGRVICLMRPEMFLVNGQPHRADGPAILWPSGTGLWFWRGVETPQWAIETPRAVTLDAIHRERNQEIRRNLAEIYGLSRYLRDSGARLVHEDEFGKLWEARVGHDFWRIVEVVNGTTEPDGSRRTYTLDVTGAEFALGWPIRTARAAVAATYGLRPEEYGPEVRT